MNWGDSRIRRMQVVLSAAILMLQSEFTASQERYELTVPGTTTRSTAELTASFLTINHQGNESVYARDSRYDVSGYVGFSSTTLRQIIRWPSTGTGALQIAEAPQLGLPQFRQSQMQITAVVPPVGSRPVQPRGGLLDTTQNYRLTNAFLGPNHSFATNPRGATSMDPSGDVATQHWRFEAVGRQTYRIKNVALGDNFSLTVHARDPRPTMEPTDPRSTAQLWRLTSLGSEVRLTNEALGGGSSLDNDGGGMHDPILAPTSNVTGQLWTFTKLASATGGDLLGMWQEYLVATNQPVGITVEIRRDLTFIQTQPGKRDRFGTVRMIGDQLSLNHTDAVPEQFRVTMTPDRIDFRELDGTPSGFFWRRIASGVIVPAPLGPRRISRKFIANPPLEPVAIELANSHSEELWVLVSDLRDATRSRQLTIPSGTSTSIMLERDAGSRVVEVWEIPVGGGRTVNENRVGGETPPKQLYDISVYELTVQSISIDRTQPGGGRVDDVNRVPKSVGLIEVPAGNRFEGGKTDIYQAAKSRKNPGAVRRVDPSQWRDWATNNDPFLNVISPRR
ncbi:MAG: hypothetical protein R3C05_31005 [Pirellulaceae bacterium]